MDGGVSVYSDHNLFPPLPWAPMDGVSYTHSKGEGEMRLPPPDADKVVKHPVVNRFHIPDGITVEEVENFFTRKKSDFEKYRVIPTVNPVERTIKMSEFDQNQHMDKLLFNKNVDQVLTLSVPFDKKREYRLKDAWHFVQSQLAGVGISSSLNLAHCYMEVASSITSLTKIPDLLFKARDLLRLLGTTSVPSFMALEIFEGSRQHNFTEIGPQQFGMKKDEHLKRWECLFRDLKELSEHAHCHLFLNETTFTAVTTTESSIKQFEQLPEIVKKYFVSDIYPDIDVVDCSIDGFKGPDSKLEAFALYTLIQEKQAIKLKKSKRMVARSLYGYKISYTLNSDKCSMAFSSIKSSNHPVVINNAGLLFELLSRTHVPASMAIEVLDGCLQAHLIKIGSQPGGLCSKHGIKNEEYVKRWKCLHDSLEALAEAGNCNVFLNENTVALVCSRSYGLQLIELFVQGCIVRNECPGNAARFVTIPRYGLESIEDPHVKHTLMETSGSLPDGLVKAASFHTLLYDRKENELIKNWAHLDSCLTRHHIPFKLIEMDSSLLVSLTTKNGVDDNIIDKTWEFVNLLSANVPLSKAIEVMDGHLHSSVTRTLYPSGILPLKFGITMADFVKRVQPRYVTCLKYFVEIYSFEIINNGDSVAVVGASTDEIERVARAVRDSFALLLGHGASMGPSKRRRVAEQGSLKASQV